MGLYSFSSVISSDTFGFTIIFGHFHFIVITNYPFHYHQDHELVYVLQGEVELKNGSGSYILKEGVEQGRSMVDCMGD